MRRIGSLLLAPALVAACQSAYTEFRSQGTSIEHPRDAELYFASCTAYSVSSDSAQKYFRRAKPVEYSQIHYGGEGIFGPCSTYGTLKLKGTEAAYRIYVGTVGYIAMSDSERQWFYCDEECCSELRSVCGYAP